MELQLNDAQAELLREILDHEYREMRYEISNTDGSTFKMELQERRDLLSSILDMLGGTLPDPATPKL